MIVWLLIGGSSALAVLAVYANYQWDLVAGWRYDWAHAKHLLIEEAEEPAPMHGSMILAEERDWQADQLEAGLRARGYVIEEFYPTEPGWREQTAADLSPEALECCPRCGQPHNEPHCADGREWGPIGSGSGGLSSLTPGPDQFPDLSDESRQELNELAGLWNRKLSSVAPIPELPPSRLADTGDITSARLASERQAEYRAQDTDAAAFMAAKVMERQDYMRDFRQGWAAA